MTHFDGVIGRTDFQLGGVHGRRGDQKDDEEHQLCGSFEIGPHQINPTELGDAR